jgi:hypothetical protein
VSLLKTAILYPTLAILEVNEVIAEIASDNAEKNTASKIPVDTRQKENNNILNTLLFLMGGLIITGRRDIMIFMLGVVERIKNIYKGIFGSDYTYSVLSWINSYRQRILKFLTPLQKCILNRSDEYDINPINIVLGGIFIISQKVTRILNCIFGVRVIFFS